MIRNQSWGRALPLCLLLAAGGAAAQTAAPTPPAAKKKPAPKPTPAPAAPLLEPKAIEILTAMSNRLIAARSLSFTAVATYESPSAYGPPLAYTTSSQVTLQRPDKLRVITTGDCAPSEFYYDGTTMAQFSPVENLVAAAPAPPTIDAMLKAAYDAAAIYFPFTDVIVADPYGDIAPGLRIAFYLGQSSVVGGTTTDMVAFESEGVFVQAWIGAEDKLPRRARAQFFDDPMQLRHQVELSHWELDPVVTADAFASSKAEAASRIKFAHPGTLYPIPAQAKPVGKSVKAVARPKAQPTPTPRSQ